MNDFGLRFHHLGLAVRNPDAALAFLRGMGYSPGPPVFDPEQNVNLILCAHDCEPAVEIIYPGVGAGPVDRLVKRYTSGIVYHMCYVTLEVERSLAALLAAGLRTECLAPSTPSVLFGGVAVSFYQVMGIGVIELIEGEPGFSVST